MEFPKEKTAENLAKLTIPPQDEYWDSIIRAARYLVSRRKATWKYCTQWASGSTLWKGPQGHSEVIKLEALEFYGF